MIGKDYPQNWWLRSSGLDQQHVASVYYNGSVSTSGSYLTYKVMGMRPAIKLDMSSIVFSTEITANNSELQSKPWMTEEKDGYEVGIGSGKSFKIGVIGDNGSGSAMALGNLTYEGIPVTSSDVFYVERGDALALMADSNVVGADIMYRLKDSGAKIVAYDTGTVNTSNSGNTVNIIAQDLSAIPENLPDGVYDADIWIQRGNAVFSHEASPMVSFKVKVDDGTPPGMPSHTVTYHANGGSGSMAARCCR